MKIQHHVDQAIKAWGIMHRDQDYAVKDGEVIIVDEFTGLRCTAATTRACTRPLRPRRRGGGPGKAGTLATITFQNYFRLYDKLLWHDGTAMTEQEEFSKSKAGRGGDPHQPAHDSGGLPRRGLQDPAGQVPGRHQRHCGAPEGASLCWWAPSPLKERAALQAAEGQGGVKHGAQRQVP